MPWIWIWGAIMFICIWLGSRQLSGKPVPLPRIQTQEEREEAEKRNAEEWELRRLDYNDEMFMQYTNHFMNMPFDSDFVKPEYREYLALEWDAWCSLSKSARRSLMKRDNNVAFRNNYCSAWENYCKALAGERMVKDRMGVHYAVKSGPGFNCYTAAHPFEAAVQKTWYWQWERTHYPELIKKYNETGVFVPGWEWQPLDEIPDYHEN